MLSDDGYVEPAPKPMSRTKPSPGSRSQPNSRFLLWPPHNSNGENSRTEVQNVVANRPVDGRGHVVNRSPNGELTHCLSQVSLDRSFGQDAETIFIRDPALLISTIGVSVRDFDQRLDLPVAEFLVADDQANGFPDAAHASDVADAYGEQVVAVKFHFV